MDTLYHVLTKFNKYDIVIYALLTPKLTRVRKDATWSPNELT